MQYFMDKELFILRRRTEFFTDLIALYEKIDYNATFDYALNDELKVLGEEYRDVTDLSTILKELTDINKHHNAA